MDGIVRPAGAGTEEARYRKHNMPTPDPIFENSPVRTFARICLHSNLPAFDDDKQMKEYLERWCGEHSNPMIARWRCPVCKCIHMVTSGGPTDSNGAFKAGADKISMRIRILVREAIKAGLDTWVLEDYQK